MTTIDQSLRGVLWPSTATDKFQLQRWLPAPELCWCVMNYWIIEWDLADQEPYTQEVLPYPCVNMVFEAGFSRIFGVFRRCSAHTLRGQGRVFGIKFQPGGFYPLLCAPVSRLTNMSILPESVFDIDCAQLEAALTATTPIEQRVAAAEQMLREQLPVPDPTIAYVRQIVSHIMTSRSVHKIDDLLEIFHISRRTLQRLFYQYVGVSPKWVIQRARLHEAAEILAQNTHYDCAHLAADLGYFDQAHFVKDFKAMIGLSPAAYARSIGGTLASRR